MAAPNTVSEPFPIFALAHKYLLYEPDVISHVRSKHNMTGVLIGGLPQAPQQNVFLGVPLELMPEEARLLVEKKAAFIVDDVQAHKKGFMSADGKGLSPEERTAYQSSLKEKGLAAASRAAKQTDDRKKAALSKLAATGDWNDIPEDMLQLGSRSTRQKKPKVRAPAPDIKTSGSATPATDEEDSLFSVPLPHRPSPSELSRTTSIASSAPTPYPVTPTTSYPPLQCGLRPPPPPPRSSSPSSSAPPSASSSPQRVPTPSKSELPLPAVPASYPLFKHMHDRDYFLAPGLRFGCQYMAYPGDPLRFHSHFLCNGMGWDDEFALLDIVGGGRLGTGVKKGFLIGGEEKAEGEREGCGAVRTFGIEWGGM
ncbi:Hypothetical protein R9X50_00749100 [Acrodontium crateriforme]|uniref:tRNA-splicing endonuclease subunit Sen34 n=1 Tax=Acrodontium crateriforme TaxID=150365 RepID=A0AAQ3MB63_9PEZI|nr:Hypothetical protein R9X50_00749100 [Acrodontium crateriforme]